MNSQFHLYGTHNLQNDCFKITCINILYHSFTNKLLTLSLLLAHVLPMSPSVVLSFSSSRYPEQADKKYKKIININKYILTVLNLKCFLTSLWACEVSSIGAKFEKEIQPHCTVLSRRYQIIAFIPTISNIIEIGPS